MDQIYFYIKNLICTLICLVIIRMFIVFLRIHQKKKVIQRKRITAKLLVILGSGGHTFEMLHLIRNANEQMRPRVYVVADTDILSEQKAKKFEEGKFKDAPPDLYVIEKIPRSREVGQSWITSFFTTFKSFISSLHLVIRHMPEAILCNGPGTCVPVCASALLIHLFGLKRITIIYVESICRVKTLSLTGKILYYIADHFLVHWPELKSQYPRAQFVGRII